MEVPEAARPGRQGSGLMRNTLLQAQCSHVNLITRFFKESLLSVWIWGGFFLPINRGRGLLIYP